LTVVGTGIQVGVHLTAEARAAIERADAVLYLLAEPVGRAWLERLKPGARSLDSLYETGRPRREIYAAIADEILLHVRRGLDVCVAFYGHPGLFVAPASDAIARAREEGFPARLLPGISAEDVLFADLGVDPAASGWQSYEATTFLVEERPVDPKAALVLWQVGVVGNELVASSPAPEALSRLVRRLLADYPPGHEVAVYEASPYPGLDPYVLRVPLGDLDADAVRGLSTLYVPPLP
jgi:uncharacterized protein YabN with tetrapyrrole methylase and pyrophosphatase domain